jgi:hypothetical protein
MAMEEGGGGDRHRRCAAFALALLAASAVAAAAQTTGFDGTYRGIERHLEVEYETLKRERYSMHSSSCFQASRPPPEFTIKDGVATVPWCLGGCRLEGPVGPDGHTILHGSSNWNTTYTMHVQLYGKGTNPQFDAIGQIDMGPCRNVLTWRKVQ